MVKLTGYCLAWLALFGVVWCNEQFNLENLVNTVHSYGYPDIEIHTVTTTDGYILKLFRIPHGKNNSNVQNKPVAFLMHGITCSASCYFAARENAAPYMLADAGFDVWVANCRGTSFSREHQTLDPDRDPQFWDFSWHEIGIYDLPSMIDYSLSATKQEKLFYIGHSEGTTINYVLLSEKPEYNEKIILQISMAPIAYLTHVGGNVGLLRPIITQALELLQNLGIHEMKRSYAWYLTTTCAIAPVFCGTLLMTITGYDCREMNKTLIRTLPQYFPGGCSTKQLQHFAQSIVQGHFRQYDYGVWKNLLRYGSATPPDYNLGNIKSPITFVTGNTDFFSDLQDAKRLIADVTNSEAKIEYRLPHKTWSHLDYIISNRVGEINDYIISQLNGYL